MPLFSYVLPGGHCGNRGVRIPVGYLLVEAATGALFAVAAYEFGDANLVTALVLLAAIDLGHRLLPSAIVFSVALAGFALSALANPGGWKIYPASVVALVDPLRRSVISRDEAERRASDPEELRRPAGTDGNSAFAR